MNPHPTSFGIFKPVDHVLMAFATDAQTDAAVGALRAAGFVESDISRYTPSEMREQAELDIGNASPLASLGQDLNLVLAHLALAEQGQSFVVVKAAAAKADADARDRRDRCLSTAEDILVCFSQRRKSVRSPGVKTTRCRPPG